ncbi:MAG: chemotaxis protein CheA [Pseudomonadota bacterium]
MDDLQQEFISETRETLDALSSELVAWESEPDHGEHLDAIFRFFHTVKGSAGFLSLPRFERLAHEAENVLAMLRETRRPITSQLVSAILALVDRIAELIVALENGLPLDHGDDVDRIQALHIAWDATSDDNDIAAQRDDRRKHDAVQPDTGDATHPARSEQQLRTIRVPLSLLDQMMNSVSDMVLARNEVARQIREMEDAPGLDSAFERLSACVGDLRDSIGRTRMQRMDSIFAPLPRIVRDLGKDLGKQVELFCSGQDVELDRELIEMIRDPLVHIIRNAIDHGLETPDTREQAGKPSAGRLEISASQSGNQVLITINDDGAGIDTGHLGEKAIAARIYDRAEINAMSENDLLNLIFAPGISTAEKVTAISGRGVGMDVVRANIERVGGAIDLQNRPGQGLKVVIRVPLTLTIISCLIFESGGHRFALPQSAVREITSPVNQQVRIDHVGDADFAVIRGEHLPVVRLGQVFGEQQAALSAADSVDTVLIVIDAHIASRYVLAVDSVTDHEDLVVRPGAPAIMTTNIFAGTTLPDNGRPMLLLDPAGIGEKVGITQYAGQIAAADTRHDGEDIGDRGDETRLSMLVFRDCQRRRRALALDIIERVEDFPVDALAFSAGQLRLTKGEQTYPVFGIDRPPQRGQIKLLQLSDGITTLFYAIDDIADIHRTSSGSLASGTVADADDACITGVIVIDGEQVEIVDGYGLFSQYAGSAGPVLAGRRPLCVLDDSDDGWTRRMLEPLIISAGYDVSHDRSAADRADVVVISDQAADDLAGKDNVIRLRQQPEAEPGSNSIYRYDRIGLIGALQANRRSSAGDDGGGTTA